MLSASAGRYTLGANVSATGIRDPVVWNGRVQYMVGMPKAERFYTSWQPGIARLSGGFSHLINHRFGLALGLTQELNLGAIRDSQWEREEISVSTSVKAEFLILFEKDYVRASVEASLYPLNKPFIVGCVYGHKFDLSGKKPGKAVAGTS